MQTLPTLFVSHGAPTFALEPGRAGAGLAALGRRLPRPQAVLVVSPHWMTRQPQATLSLRPETIHDFGGFDPALYTLRYPAEGAHLAAHRALELLQAAGLSATPNADRGLDHGAWVPLLHLYPKADIPVFQVSLPVWLDADGAYQYGRALAPLADEGVLIVGSGSLTHNLYEFRLGDPRAEGYAAEFAHWVRDAVLAGDHERLRQALVIAPHARRAHPTVEHYLPLLVAAGAAAQAVPASVIEGGIVHGVLSMDSFLFGAERTAMQGAATNNALPN
ncbi:class III extradiol ring-cleavage dioxygenase [Thauera sp.]|uniref:dioxygenase family protein n=1 Tax=Thauera sp. TaxID=1905334 RepID=UPI002BE2C041|nr:class III extradiol ring-cleavage dioxygenase [Thauera sp.]HRP23456.1 class III extradiol ring-cleavage dioxygenase [Thauera sp.]